MNFGDRTARSEEVGAAAAACVSLPAGLRSMSELSADGSDEEMTQYRGSEQNLAVPDMGRAGAVEAAPVPRTQQEESRPPPIHLGGRGHPRRMGAFSSSNSFGDGSTSTTNTVESSSRAPSTIGGGAYVDAHVFKYQPGAQSPPESVQAYKISLRGAALMGGVDDLSGGGGAGLVDIASEYERRKGHSLTRYRVKDHRAKQLLVVPSDDKFVALAAPEAFSRHSGTCMILGGQGAYASGAIRSYELKLGNFLRIGSVGVVVSEINTGVPGEHKCLSWEELTCLKGDIAAMQKDLVTVEALTAQEEAANARKLPSSSCMMDDDDDCRSRSSSASSATAAVEMLDLEEEGAPGCDDSPPPPSSAAGRLITGKMCYMCFDEEDAEDNPLVAPCQCLGDTRYVHINCLQQWHTTTADNKVCMVLNNKGVRVCTVCKTPYKASVRLPNGSSISLFKSPLEPPYVCFMVVTKHLNNEDLFSTKYQLSFASVVNRNGTGSTRSLIIGRSRQCDMVLDYRTVSTRHANIRFSAGNFYFTDMMSSNGSYLYVREPLQLPYGEAVFLKWGSNVVSLKAKRSIRHRLSTLVGRRVGSQGGSGSLDLSMLGSLCDLTPQEGGTYGEEDDVSVL
jgi:hypothetical protein